MDKILKETSFSKQFGTDGKICDQCQIHGHPRTFWQRLGRFRPDTVLDLMIRVPFFSVHTEVLTYLYERREWVYFMFYIKIWRWEFNFRFGRRGL